VVEVEGLTKRFGARVAVDSVALRIPRGSAFGYLGPNGAGKTTLIRMLLGPTPPTAGAAQGKRNADPRSGASFDGTTHQPAIAFQQVLSPV
jgi:ABC-type multidrug transport system ATPase subunit